MNSKKLPKFRSAAAKRRYLEAQASWNAIVAKYQPMTVKKLNNEHLEYNLRPPPGRESKSVPSLITAGGSATVTSPMKYSGTEMIGIATMHKSNSVPVFRKEDARDIASMRR